MKVPIRMTCARWLSWQREYPEKAKKVEHITTPAGYITYLLCCEHRVGIGELSGMFPVDSTTDNVRIDLADKFSNVIKPEGIMPILSLLPQPVRVGEWAGKVTKL